MTRNEFDVYACDQEDGFDWDLYQYLCDCAEYSDVEE